MDGKMLIAVLLQLAVQRCLSDTVVRPYEDQTVWLSDEENEEIADMIDWSRHPCRRACKDDESPMECHYSFHVEHYYTMSKACYDCPYNFTDCFRPHCIPADGVYRPLVVVNKMMPGPAIEVCEGDKIVVDVTNMLHSDSTTVHWHGQHMRFTPYMDGTPMISQCPILPKDTFRYAFVAETPGTQFWHSHVGFQRGDGMFGPLIVRRQPKRDQLRNLYDYDDHLVTIYDWDHELGLEKYLAHNHGVGDNKPPTILINGRGRFADLPDRDGVAGVMPITIFNVKPNAKHRFRIMNAEFLNCPIEVSVDNHTIWIVSSDGKDLEPVEARSVVTYAGERFDIIIEANQSIDNYWMRFRGLLDCGANFTKAHQVAILRYEGAPEKDPIGDISYDALGEEILHPQINSLNRGTESKDILSIPRLEALDKDDAANTREPDYQFYIGYDIYPIDNEEHQRKGLYGYYQVKHRTGTPQLNHITMKMPSFPLMSQTEQIDTSGFCNASTVQDCETDFCTCPHVLQVKLDSVVEVILIDEGVPYDANHPFHLHGHNFRVLAMERLGKSVTVEEVKRADREGRIHRKLDRAPIKDTVTVPDGGYTVIRFHANNPGYWFFHCHLEFHSEMGMALVFKVGEHKDFAPVPTGFPRCHNYQPNPMSHPLTTMNSVNKNVVDDPSENEISHVDEKVRSSIANWLPLILSELRAASSSGFALTGSLLLVAAGLVFTF